MYLKTIALQIALAGLSVAQLQPIQGALTDVKNSLTKLDNAVKALDDANTAGALLTASNDMQMVVQSATQQISGAQQLPLQDALTLQQTGTDLAGLVKTIMTDLEGKKPVLDQLGITQQVVQVLKDQKKNTAAMGQALVSKVPAIGQGITQQSMDQVTEDIDDGITKLGGKPDSARRSIAIPLRV